MDDKTEIKAKLEIENLKEEKSEMQKRYDHLLKCNQSMQKETNDIISGLRETISNKESSLVEITKEYEQKIRETNETHQVEMENYKRKHVAFTKSLIDPQANDGDLDSDLTSAIGTGNISDLSTEEQNQQLLLQRKKDKQNKQ